MVVSLSIILTINSRKDKNVKCNAIKLSENNCLCNFKIENVRFKVGQPNGSAADHVQEGISL